MRLPRRPIRSLLRFLWRAVVAWFVVGLDLGKRAPEATPPPRRRGEIIQSTRRRDHTP